MSKIIEALEKVREYSARPSESARSGSESKRRPNTYQATQEELAEVYFSRSGKAQQALPGPTLVRVVDRQTSYFWPWVVTTGALVFVAFALIFTGRVDVNVRMSPRNGLEPATQVSMRAGPALPLLTDSFYFSESAEGRSAKGGKELRIAGSLAEGQVYAALHFVPPFDARGYELEFEARGEAGGENVEIFFRDVNRQTSLNQGVLRPFPSGLAAGWEKAAVAVSSADGFDASRVALLRIETGQRTGHTSSAGAVFIRNLKWKPRSKA